MRVREPAEVAALIQAAAASVTAQITDSEDDEPTEEQAEASADELTTSKPAAPIAPPPVDYSSVEIVDARPGPLSPAAPTRQPSHRIGTGGPSKAPSVQTEEENRRVGKRGEEVGL